MSDPKPALAAPPVVAQEEPCSNCQRMVPRRFIALELQDGAPLVDEHGNAQQWCVVCHDQKVLALFKARAEAAAAQLHAVRQIVSRMEQDIDKIHVWSQDDFLAWAKQLRAALPKESPA